LTRALRCLRAVYGAVLLTVPRRRLEPLTGPPLDSLGLGICRVLGIRQLLQAALGAGQHPSRRRQLEGAAVDGAHAGSMLALAALSPPRRTFGLRSALASSAMALIGTASALATPPTQAPTVRRTR
jgi:hypothetical protein